jgi:hypothetical protein
LHLKGSYIIRIVIAALTLLTGVAGPCRAQEQKVVQLSTHALANADTVKVLHDTTLYNAETEGDTVLVRVPPYQPDPKKSGLYSAIIPGLGQMYNHQWWKVPVVYAGLATAGYFIVYYSQNYQDFRKAYIGRINNPYPTDPYVKIYTVDQLQQLQADYNKYLDMTILYTVMGFSAQVIDAIVSAHLKNFDISRDITLRVRPVVLPGGIGAGLVMNFRH